MLMKLININVKKIIDEYYRLIYIESFKTFVRNNLFHLKIIKIINI